MSLLGAIVLVPVIGALIAALAGRLGPQAGRFSALAATAIDLALSLVLLMAVQTGGPAMLRLEWIRAAGVSFHLYADGFSAVLVVLTTVLGVLSVMISWKEIRERVCAFHFWLLLLQTGILLVFLARDLLLFYFGWELMLVPMFFLIGVWGHEEKLYSAYKFFLFTFTGSVFVIVAIMYVYWQHAVQFGELSFGFDDLLQTRLSPREQWWVFLGLFVGFAVKVPLFPLHTWLPDAHTQAPTAGSLILAGLLLKTGVYGIVRFAIPLVPLGAEAFTPLAIGISIFGIFYGAVTAFAQRDFKRLVAYSSISHLGFVVLGVFCGNSAGMQGAALQMVNHGLATGALFIIAGMLQERTHTRNIEMFGGLWKQMPTLGAFLLFFSLASLGLPGTGNFVGELYVIAGAFLRKPWLGEVTAFGVVAAAAYSLRLFVVTMHGPESKTFRKLPDTTHRENAVLASLAMLLLLIGFYPRSVTAPLFSPPDSVVPLNGREPDTLAPVAASVPHSAAFVDEETSAGKTRVDSASSSNTLTQQKEGIR
jgi:NADH-quinone oxidoreductase subunit M